jgi:hypothetical protein
MISCELQGRLANMMFQIASIENMGYKSGIQTCYPHVDKNIDDLAKPQACTSELNGRRYFSLFKNFDWHKNHDKNMEVNQIIKVPFEYSPIIPQDYTCYIGYFQCELFFPDRDFILNLFEPADFVKEKLEKYKDIIGYNKASIHVRRGDYIKLNHVHNVLNMDYYNEAMKILGLCGVNKYLVFSTDEKWCRDNFKGEKFIFIQDDPFVELYLMSQCAHQIIANNAFSWWGAWLNNNPNKQVVSPRKWFTNNQHNDKDIIPKTWIKL